MTNAPTPHDKKSLQDLYPAPKTYEERVRDDELRQERYRQRRPRYVRTRIALLLTAAYVAILLLIANIQMFWAAGIAGVSLSYAAGIAIVLLLAACFRYISKAFYVYGWSTPVFMVVYLFVAFGLVRGYFMVDEAALLPMGWLLPFAALVHCGLTLGVLALFGRADEPES